MNGWNRLFVVVSVCWAVAAPIVLMKGINEPIEHVLGMCLRDALRDTDKYEVKKAACSEAFKRDFVTLPEMFSAMVGLGDRQRLGYLTRTEMQLFAWGLILIPLILLWVVGWGLGK